MLFFRAVMAQVKRIINEPTAAALAFGVMNGDRYLLAATAITAAASIFYGRIMFVSQPHVVVEQTTSSSQQLIFEIEGLSR